MDQIFDPFLFEGYWPSNTQELSEIMHELVARIKKRSPAEYHPFFVTAVGYMQMVFAASYGVPRSMAGSYVVLMRIFTTCEDEMISDNSLTIILAKINALTLDYINSKIDANRHNLRTVMVNKRKKDVAPANS